MDVRRRAAGEAIGEDADWLADAVTRVGAVVCGRWTYEAADRWGGENSWGLPLFVVTHRPEDEPEGKGFTFVSGVEEPSGRRATPPGARTST